jgi:Uma2 family endonuclease
MLMETETRRWSRLDLETLPNDANSYEVLDGALFVTPQASYPHQVIATRLLMRLAPWLENNGLGVAVGPGAVVFGDSELHPDIVVTGVSPDQVPELWTELPVPILAVEILSRSTRTRDLTLKRQAYLRIGVAEYWVIDRFARNALVWTEKNSDPAIETTGLRWSPTGAPEPLVILLADIFPSAKN